MQVTLLFFAATRDAVGSSTVDVDLPAQVKNAAQLLQWLGERYPQLEAYLPFLRIAQNEQFVKGDCILHPGDTLAVIPPVAGG